MAIRIPYQYPEDPPATVDLMFGLEFITNIRKNKPGKITISASDRPTQVIEVDEVICDSCNAEVLSVDPCALVEDHGRLYCFDCYKRLIRPYCKLAEAVYMLEVNHTWKA